MAPAAIAQKTGITTLSNIRLRMEEILVLLGYQDKVLNIFPPGIPVKSSTNGFMLSQQFCDSVSNIFSSCSNHFSKTFYYYHRDLYFY